MKFKFWIIFATVASMAIATWFFVSRSNGVVVEAVSVTTGPIREFVDERATTRLPKTFLITMPSSGRIEPITLTEGTRVGQGQVLARIVPGDLELAVKQADAVVERLEESIRENADTGIEATALEQTARFVESMEETVKAAEARVESGRAKYEYAERNLGRIQKLFDDGAGTEVELELAKLGKITDEVAFRQDQLVHGAMLSMKQATDLLPEMVRRYIENKKLAEAVLQKQKAEAEVGRSLAMQDQARGEMTSPIDGVVLARHASNERFLTAGTTLLEVGQLEDLEVEADVLSLDVVEVQVGTPVEIHGPAIGKTYARGTVKRIHPAGFTKISSLGVEQQRVKVVIGLEPEDLARVQRERNLGVGYRVRARIITAQKPEARIIPRSALFRASDGQWQVHAIRDGHAHVQTVEIGMINDTLAEVLAGLEVDEQVVRAPESNLEDGCRVTIASGR